MAGPAPVQPGDQIDILELGADIKLPDGRTIDDVPENLLSEYSIQPSHRYVFLLEYHPDGNFFTGEKHWELEDGFVIPQSPDDILRAQHGQSKYAGMREDRFIKTLREDLAQRQ